MSVEDARGDSGGDRMLESGDGEAGGVRDVKKERRDGGSIKVRKTGLEEDVKKGGEVVGE